MALANLAPFSFFSGVGSNPPTVLFCPVVRKAGSPTDVPSREMRKDTLRNVEETGEFVVNIVSESHRGRHQCYGSRGTSGG